MLNRDAMARYIHGSNSLDGCTLSLEQTLSLLDREPSLTDSVEVMSDDGKSYEAGIVTGHKRAVEAMLKMASGKAELTQDAIKGLHETMMGDLLLSAGEYRECSLRIKGLLIGSPPEGLERNMGAFVQMVQRGLAKAKDFNVLAWKVHHEFFTLHPFIEGNGRMARLLLNFVKYRGLRQIAILSSNDRERYGKAIIDFQKQKIQKRQKSKS